jgi:hypothetical protein
MGKEKRTDQERGRPFKMSIIRWCFHQLFYTLFITIISVTATLWVVGGYVHQVLPEWKPPQAIPLEWIQKSWDLLLGQNAITAHTEGMVPSETAFANEVEIEPEPESEHPAPLLTSDPQQDSSSNEVYYVWKGNETSTALAESVGREMLTMDQVESQKGKMTSKEKMDLFSLIISKVPQTEVEAMWAMIDDGVTEIEAEKIQNTLKQYLNDKEYEIIEKLILKYQG